MGEQQFLISATTLTPRPTRKSSAPSWLPQLLAVIFLSATASLGMAQPVASNSEGAASEQGLVAALQATLRYHPAIKGKQAEIEASNGLVSSAKAGRYPDLSGQTQALDNGDNSGSLRLRQPLWAFGRIDAAIDHAEAQRLVEQQLFLQVQRNLIKQVAVAYARVQSLRGRLLISKTNVQEHGRLQQQIETRQQGQLASVADVRLATSRLIRAQGDYQRLLGERDAALTQLRRLTQIKVEAELPLTDEQLLLPPVAQIQPLALATSADILLKQAEAEVARWNIKNTRLADAPTLYFQVDQDVLDAPRGRDRTQASLVFEARTEGFGFSSRGRAKSAESRYKAAQFDIDSSRNEIRRELETLLLNRSLQGRLQGSQQAAVAAVEDTLASFIRQYDSGRKSWIDVLNTQREVTEVKQQLALINNEWQTSTLRIAALIGALDHIAGITPK